MPKILSIGNKEKKPSNNSPLGFIWEWILSLDKFTKIFLLTTIFISIVTPAIVSTYLIFNPYAVGQNPGSIEAESTALSGSVSVGSDSNASANSFIQFGTSTGGNQAELVNIVSDVTTATASKFGAKDSSGNSMDTVKIIENSTTAGDSSRYLAVYHTLSGTSFNLKIASSSDLLTWTYLRDLDTNAHQPTLAKLSDGSFVLAYEIGATTACTGTGGAGNNCLKFRHYSNLTNLLAGTYDKQFIVPRTLSNCAEGTPHIQSVTLNPDINTSVIDVRFHYFRNCDVDRQARGTLTNFNSWTAQVDTNLNTLFETLTDPSIAGNVGDRDRLAFKGGDFNLHEAQITKGDFCSWRPYIYDYSSSQVVKLTVKTSGGRVAFANPSFTNLTLPNGTPGVVVSYFIPSSSGTGVCAGSDPAGQLIFYKQYSNTTAAVPKETGRVASATSTSFTFGAVGDTGVSTEADATLRAIKDQGFNFFLHLGDFRYGALTDTGYCDYIKQRTELNPSAPVFPFEIIAGNHEYNSGDGNIDNIRLCLPDRLGAIGDYAKRYYFDYPAGGTPLARFIFAIPGLGGSYGKGQADYNWVSNTIDDARAQNIPWVILAYHKTCITMYASRGCESGQDIMNLAYTKKVDLLFNGHDHHYQRGKQLAISSTCLNVPYNSTSGSSCIVDPTTPFTKGVGTVTVTQGMGGHGLYSLSTSDGDSKYFETWNDTAYGFVKYTVTDTQITGEFKRTYGGTYSDNFSIGSSCAGDCTAPTVSVTAPANGSVVSGAVNIAADANDNVGLARVEFLVDGVVKSTDTTSPYNYSWDSKTVSNGAHTIQAKAYDTATNSTTSATVTVTVDNPICNPPTDKGMATTTVTLDAGTYKIWSRVMTPDNINNSYYLQIDNECGINVGDSSITPGSWTWIDYKDADLTNKTIVNISSGTHTIKLIGKESGVKLDRLILTPDQSCVPLGTGDNCISTPTPTVIPTAIPTSVLPSPVPTSLPTIIPSPTPSLPPSPVDTDGDGFTDAVESHIGTDPLVKCSNLKINQLRGNPSATWPPDLWTQQASGGKVTIQDITSYVAPIRRLDTTTADANYDKRYDLDANGLINNTDIELVRAHINTICN